MRAIDARPTLASFAPGNQLGRTLINSDFTAARFHNGNLLNGSIAWARRRTQRRSVMFHYAHRPGRDRELHANLAQPGTEFRRSNAETTFVPRKERRQRAKPSAVVMG